MIKKFQLAGLIGLSMTLIACNNSSEEVSSGSEKEVAVAQTSLSLKAHFSNSFDIGTAISRAQILNETGDNDLAIVKEHFNSFTPENSMKWERIHPELDTYDFKASDALVEFANKNNMELVGHTLVWHSQTPEWVFQNEAGEPLSRDELLARMQQHINTVAGRYKGKIAAWDVVNEALNEDGTLRESPWSKVIGDDFIIHAFKFAQAAAPNAKLYYNDYNLFKPEKRNGVIQLVKSLKEAGARIDGVGMQGHYALDYPDLNQMEDSIIAFAAEDVDVMITELDVSVLPFPEDEEQGADVSVNVALNAKYNPYSESLPENVHTQLAERYSQIFTVLKKHSEKIGRVTFWGVHDKQSWRNGWPMTGRTDYPLLIDREFKVKDFVSAL